MGKRGVKGSPGQTGPPGSQGFQGETGSPGLTGFNRPPGADGKKGSVGKLGPKGSVVSISMFRWIYYKLHEKDFAFWFPTAYKASWQFFKFLTVRMVF